MSASAPSVERCYARQGVLHVQGGSTQSIFLPALGHIDTKTYQNITSRYQFFFGIGHFFLQIGMPRPVCQVSISLPYPFRQRVRNSPPGQEGCPGGAGWSIENAGKTPKRGKVSPAWRSTTPPFGHPSCPGGEFLLRYRKVYGSESLPDHQLFIPDYQIMTPDH